MHSISNHIADVDARISRAAARCGRDRRSVRLIAVSKAHNSDAVREAADAGLVDFGENYVAEALAKIADLCDRSLYWHFIGTIQSNKTREIARHFQWVQTIDRLKIAERLSAQRPDDAEPLDVLIQVNIDAEPQKAGIDPAALAEFAAPLLKLPRLRLRGLMAIPRREREPERQRLAFRRMHALFQDGKPHAAEHWDTLSMGMTQDFEAAIEEGATMIRVGTALFGTREPRTYG
jgi:pyridoxal phosphate enzyme (YggS family)